MKVRDLAAFVDFAVSRAAARRGVSVPVFEGGLQGALNPFATEPPVEKLGFTAAVELIPAVYSCITKIQNTCADLPLVILEKGGKTPQEPKPWNPAWLFGNANEDETGYELRTQVLGSQLSHGTGYVFWDYDGGDFPKELWCLQPERIEPFRPKGSRKILYYIADLGNGKKEIIPKYQITRFPFYSPRLGTTGLSPLQVAQVAYSTQRHAMLWLDQWYRKGAQASGFLIPDVDHGIQPKEEERILRTLRQKWQGLRNAMNPVLLPRGMKFEKASVTMRDMQFLETHKLTNADIYNIFGIPPVIMGVKEGGGLSSAGSVTDMVLFYRLCIMPLLKRMQSVLNERVFQDLVRIGEFGFGLTAYFDYSTVPVLQLEQLEIMEKATVANGGSPPFSANEFRKATGFGPSPDKKHDEIPDRPVAAADTTGPGGGSADKGKKASTAKDGTPGDQDRPALIATSEPDWKFVRARQEASVGSQHRVMAVGVTKLGKLIEDQLVAKLRQVLEPEAASVVAGEGLVGLELAERWVEYLAGQPEHGMQLHYVDVSFQDAPDHETRLPNLGVVGGRMLMAPERVAWQTIVDLTIAHAPPRRAVSRQLTAAEVFRLSATIDGEDLLRDDPAYQALMRRYMAKVSENAGYQELANVGLDVGFRIRGERVGRHLASRSEIMILGTTRTTRRMVVDALNDGIRIHDTPPELIARVREIVRERYYGQSNVIVRTETLSAWNFGANESWMQANEQNPGLIEGKQWVTSRDELVRGHDPKDGFNHVAADLQVVEVAKPFVVSGQSMMFPGDHSQGASPGNTILCRCTAVPKLSQLPASSLKVPQVGSTFGDVTLEELLR